MPQKTNIEHLRDLINDHVGEKQKDECLEFLESIETDQSELADEVKDLESKLDNAENAETDEPEYDNEIDVRMGPNDNLYWKCDNLAIQPIMEAIDEALKTTTPLEIVRRING